MSTEIRFSPDQKSYQLYRRLIENKVTKDKGKLDESPAVIASASMLLACAHWLADIFGVDRAEAMYNDFGKAFFARIRAAKAGIH